MICRAEEMQKEQRANMRGGNGTVALTALLGDNLPKNCRLASLITLQKGTSIGAHQHMGESEIFYILSGSVIYNDNGQEVILNKGDACVAHSGESHSVCGNSDDPAILLAVIILQ